PPTPCMAQVAIDLSAALLPSRRARPALVSGTTTSPMVSMPPSDVPMTAAVFQSTDESAVLRASPASLQHSRAAMTAYFIDVFEFLRSSDVKYPLLVAAEMSGVPATVHPKPNSFICGQCEIPDLPPRKACRNAIVPMAFGATTPRPVMTTRFKTSAPDRICARAHQCGHI